MTDILKRQACITHCHPADRPRSANLHLSFPLPGPPFSEAICLPDVCGPPLSAHGGDRQPPGDGSTPGLSRADGQVSPGTPAAESGFIFIYLAVMTCLTQLTGAVSNTDGKLKENLFHPR
ncbi:hypothetical protein DPEC_G00314680 [Dallia pectoralis]|uniref:Uncharacterized protein n=1 Tax=Dallia pectoralis TaxID=75939 RepID=A0ACC2FCI0_DALPE|nr:hypothetical protein DPEC_G00314680 [Dallia pectoralis]